MMMLKKFLFLPLLMINANSVAYGELIEKTWFIILLYLLIYV